MIRSLPAGLRRGAAVGAAALAASALAGCSNQIGASGNQGFVGGTGTITPLAVADRKQPGTVAGTTLAGRRVSLADFRGKVVVVNVWGSWCPPCRAEAPTLAAAARELAPRGVVFLGINSRDPERAGPRAFDQRYQIPYDSIYDPGGRTLLAFHGTLSPNSIPSTLVIDKQGRVAASVVGTITRTTIVDLVEDVARTPSGRAGGGTGT